MPVDLENLPDTIEELKAIIKSEIPKHADQIKERDSQIYVLKDQVKSLKHQLYGRKSEKLSTEEYQQSRLFNEAEETISRAKYEESKIQVKAHDRKKPGGRKPFSEDLPREEIIIDIPEEEKHCDCGHSLKKIGEEVTEKADIIPAKIVIKKYIRPKYACPHCKGADADGSGIKTSPMPSEILPKSRVTAGFLAWSLNSKFNIHMPFYRQEQILKSLGVDINRDDLSRYAIRTGKILEEKILPLMWNDLMRSPIIGADETPFKLLIRPDINKKKVKQVYMNVFHGSGPPLILFKYQPTRKIKFFRELLHDYKGAVMTDDYGGYNWLHAPGSPIKHLNCMAHVRRKFFDAAVTSKNAIAMEGFQLIRKLYAVEKTAREENFTPAQKLALRQKESVPVMEEFHRHLLRSNEITYPGGPLDKAVSYTLKIWPRLKDFLTDGGLPIDNNIVENAIRPFALGRKNWLFAAAEDGASASAAIYSITQTAKLTGHDVYTYLSYLFEELPKANCEEKIRALLPYNLAPIKAI